MSYQQMDDDGLRLKSQKVRKGGDFRYLQPDVWYYEERNGLFCVVEYECMDGLRKNQTFIIPRKQILEYARVAKDLT